MCEKWKKCFSMEDLFGDESDRVLISLSTMFGPSKGTAQRAATYSQNYGYESFYTTLNRSERLHTPIPSAASNAEPMESGGRPNEIWVLIMKRLTHLPDIMRCTRVCRRWKALVEEQVLPTGVHVFSQWTLAPEPRSRIENRCVTPQQMIATVKPFISNTLVKLLYRKLGRYLTDVSFESLLNSCRCANCGLRGHVIRDLRALPAFRSEEATAHAYFAEMLLERFWEKRCIGTRDYSLSFRLDDEWLQLLGEGTPKLHYLNLFGVDLSHGWGKMLTWKVGPKVKLLVLGANYPGCRDQADDHYARWIGRFPHLRLLAIREANGGEDLPNLLTKLSPTLQYLDLGETAPVPLLDPPLQHQGGAEVAGVGVKSLGELLAERCPELRFLSIRLGGDISASALNAICLRLKVLCINLHSSIYGYEEEPYHTALHLLESDRYLASVPFYAPELRTLIVCGNGQWVPDVGRLLGWILSGIAQYSSTIRKLELRALGLSDDDWSALCGSAVASKFKTTCSTATLAADPHYCGSAFFPCSCFFSSASRRYSEESRLIIPELEQL